MSLTLKTLQLSGRSLTSVPSRTFINSEGVKKWAFAASGFNQYGLYRDDCLYESDDVKVRNLIYLKYLDYSTLSKFKLLNM